MIITIALASTSIISHDYHFFLFFFVVKHIKSTLSKFQVCNTVLLTIITILYMKSPEFIHLITGVLYLLLKKLFILIGG